jgi:hypothetical protein
MNDCNCLNSKLVYLIAKNGMKMYFHQCFECGRTFDKFLNQSNIDLKTAIEYDKTQQDDYTKSLKNFMKLNKIQVIYKEGKQVIKTTKQSKSEWHKANKPSAVEIYNGRCGICNELTGIEQGVIHHYSYPAGVYLQNVKDLIDKKICVWLCKACHEDIHTPQNEDELENGFYKILGKCSICSSKTDNGYERAKIYNSDVKCLCKFCADGTSNVLVDFYRQYIQSKETKDFRYMELMEFIRLNLISKSEKSRKKVIHKVRRAGILERTDSGTYFFSEPYTNYICSIIEKNKK